MEKDINGKGPNIEKYGSLTGELVKTTIGPTPEALTIKLQKATIELEASLKSVKEAKERLQASEYANAQLISEVDLLKKRTRTIAHDMRGPFNSLMGFSNTLQEGGLDEETEKM